MNKIFERLRAARNDEGGFTLTEVIVVISIIVILGAMALPIYGSVKGASRQAAVNTTAREAYSLVQAALNDDDPATDPNLIADSLDTGNIEVISYLPPPSDTVKNGVCAYAEWIGGGDSKYRWSMMGDPGCLFENGTVGIS